MEDGGQEGQWFEKPWKYARAMGREERQQVIMVQVHLVAIKTSNAKSYWVKCIGWAENGLHLNV